MKLIFITAIIILITTSVYAQTGMPQSLSCTETAFNFSFSLGSDWKLSPPKMGPVEIRNATGEMPSWSLKIRNTMPETHPSSPKPNYTLPALKLDTTNFYQRPLYKNYAQTLIDPLPAFHR